MATATTLAVREPEAPVTREQILAELGLRANDPKAALAVALCQRYNLDPVLKHVLVIKGNVYVTRDGLLYVAHKSGQLDGMEVLDMGETQSHYTARVAVYRKDMTRPFVYPGRYPKGGSNKDFGPEMAVKVSEVMGLRRAFSIAASVLEERWDTEEGQLAVRNVDAIPTHAQAAAAPARQNRIASAPLQAEDVQDATFETLGEPTPPESIPGVRKGASNLPAGVTPQQVKDLWTVATTLGFSSSDDDKTYIREFYSWIVERDTIASVKDFTRAEANEILTALTDTNPDGTFTIKKGASEELLNEFNALREMDPQTESEDGAPPADPDEGRPRE
jgi:hypothetical protein